MEVYGEKKLHSKEAYYFYKKNYTADIKYKAREYETWAKIHREIWREITNSLLASEAGLYIKKFGYLAIVMLPYRQIVRKVITKNIKYTYYNDHSDNKVYTINYFSNLVKNNKFRYCIFTKVYLF